MSQLNLNSESKQDQYKIEESTCALTEEEQGLLKVFLKGKSLEL